VFAEGAEDDVAGGAVSPEMLLSFDEFRAIMEEHDVLPMFLTPHNFPRHRQLPALRNLTPAEREVVLLLGSDVRPARDSLLINYDERARHFYFVLAGELAIERSGVTLQRVREGEFAGEAALFEDIKAKGDDGATTFTTAARVVADGTHALALDIRCALIDGGGCGGRVGGREGLKQRHKTLSGARHSPTPPLTPPPLTNPNVTQT
jgi:hypothetical protein